LHFSNLSDGIVLELDTNHPFGIKHNYITRSLLQKEPWKIDNNILKHFIIEKLTSILNEEEKPVSVEALKDIVYRWNGIVSFFIELKSIAAPSVTLFSTFECGGYNHNRQTSIDRNCSMLIQMEIEAVHFLILLNQIGTKTYHLN
jgi:hypothetical protein